MAIKVKIPGPLQKLTQDKPEVVANGSSVKDLLIDLEGRFPGLQERICDEEGKVKRFVNIYVNDEDIRFLEGEASLLQDGDEVSIVPAIAGG